MTDWVKELLLFCFGGLFTLIAVEMILAGSPGWAVCVLAFTVLLVGVASVGPSTIKTLGAKWGTDGGQIGFDRYQPTKKELKLVEELTEVNPPPQILEEGQEFITQAKKRPPEKRSPEEYLTLAWDKCRAKQYEMALEDVFAGLALKPKNPRIEARLVNVKGVIFEGLGMTERAAELFKEALQIDPNYSNAHNNLGLFYKGQGKQEEAETEFKKAILLDPKNALPLSNLGLLYVIQGKLDEAETVLRKAIKVDPKSTEAHGVLGLLYKTQGKPEEAEAALRKVLELDTQGKPEEAEAALRKVLELDPKSSAAHANLGLLYKTQLKVKGVKSSFIRH